MIARVIAQRIARFHTSPRIQERLAFLEAKERQLGGGNVVPFARTPYFCSGCPHNTSTKVPEGSRAVAGIGCHYLAQFMDRSTATFTQMGGEGVAVDRPGAVHRDPAHLRQSRRRHLYPFGRARDPRRGRRQGQHHLQAAVQRRRRDDRRPAARRRADRAGIDPPARRRRRRAASSSSPTSPTNTRRMPDFAPGITVRHRDDLDAVQRELREIPGVTAIVYDQTCAAEKRRRRKRGRFPDPAKRVFINDLVCEGCGDCSKTSNCVSVVPVETEFGRKRAIDQSSCNKDYSCVNGFCPSFVTVHGGGLKKRRAGDLGEDGPAATARAGASGARPSPTASWLPASAEPASSRSARCSAWPRISKAKGCTVLDMTGLAQKGGAVYSHVRIARKPDEIHAVRIAAGDAELLLGCDLVVSASADALTTTWRGRSRSTGPARCSRFRRSTRRSLTPRWHLLPACASLSAARPR